MNSASTAQISFKALVKKLSGMEAVDIAGDGFNITDASKDDMVSIIDKIRIELAMHSDSYVAYGTGVSSDAIESVEMCIRDRLNSIDISPTSTVQVTPSSLESLFIDVRTRHAPVPHESIIKPTRPITEAFSIRSASEISALLSALV